MMNLFGVPVPDDVAAAFLAATANKRAEEVKKSFKSDAPFSKNGPSDIEGKAKRSADAAKKFFDAYMEQGFTREEAFKLTIGNLNIKF